MTTFPPIRRVLPPQRAFVLSFFYGLPLDNVIIWPEDGNPRPLSADNTPSDPSALAQINRILLPYHTAEYQIEIIRKSFHP